VEKSYGDKSPKSFMSAEYHFLRRHHINPNDTSHDRVTPFFTVLLGVALRCVIHDVLDREITLGVILLSVIF
jgi:hypothetical protein